MSQLRGPCGHKKKVRSPLARIVVPAALSFLFAPIASAQVAAESATLNAQAAKGAQGMVVPTPRTQLPAGNRTAASSDERTAASAGPSCTRGFTLPIPVRLSAGKSTMINLPERIVRRTVGDPSVVDSRMVSPQVLYLASGRIGTTNAILEAQSGRCTVLEIAVTLDTEAVQGKLSELLPLETGIKIASAADSLVLTGTATNSSAADQAIEIATAYVRSAYQPGTGDGGGQGGGSNANLRVMNLLGIGAPQQVMLEVKVAEVSKTLLEKIGVGLTHSRKTDGVVYSVVSDFLTGGNGVIDIFRRSKPDAVTLDAQKDDGLIKVLAEPNVMAISGQEGSFLSGGKIFIPVEQSNSSGARTITLEEKEFGIALKFTPTVLAGGRINLRVAPEVSELNREGIGISAPGITGGAILPSFSTRRAATTVQLMDGQSFAIGGLIKNNVTTNIKAFPFLGEIPVLGALFRSTDFQTDRSELVFVITPRLVKPLPPDYRLPTDDYTPPNRSDLHLLGRMEGTPPREESAASGESVRPQSDPAAGGFEPK